MNRHRDATDIDTHPGMRQGIQSVALEIAWEENTLVHLSHLFRVMQAEVNEAPAIDKTVFTLAFSALYLSYLLNEILLSTGSHQRPVEQGKHGITPVMIEVNGPEVLGIHEHRAEGTPDQAVTIPGNVATLLTGNFHLVTGNLS